MLIGNNYVFITKGICLTLISILTDYKVTKYSGYAWVSLNITKIEGDTVLLTTES